MKTMTKKPGVDFAAVAATIHAATETRCACGDHGSWDAADTVGGTSGLDPCVWAGCPNCSGSAIGVPVKSGDLAVWRKLSLRVRQELIAVAAVKRVFGDAIEIGYGVDWYDGAYHVSFSDGDSPTYRRGVEFVDGQIVLAAQVRGYRD